MTRRWAGPALTAWVLLIAGLHARELALFFGRYFPFPPLPGVSLLGMLRVFMEQAVRVGGTLLFFWTAWAAGSFIRERFLRREETLVEAPFVDAALGLSVLAFLGFLLAAAGLARPWIVRSVGLFATASSLWTRRGRSLLPSSFAGIFWKGASRPFRWLVGSFLALGIFLCAVPETFPDALAYFLPLPATILKQGRLACPEGSLLFYYPALAQMVSLWGLAFGDDRFCKLLTFGTTLLGAAGLAAWTARKFGPSAGRWTGLFLLSSPIVFLYGTTASADPFELALLFAALVLWEEGRDRPAGERIRLLTLAGFLAGAAAAAKYTALFASPFFLFDAFRRRQTGRLTAGECGAVLTAAVLPLIPWWTWNVVRGKGPFFPVWDPSASPLQRELLDLIAAEQKTGLPFLSRLGLLFEKSLTGVRDGRYSFVGPAVLMSLPGFLFFPWRTTRWAAYLPASLLAFASTAGLLRYYMPHFPLWFAAAGAAFAAGTAAVPPFWRAASKATAAVVLISLGASMALASHVFNQAGEIWSAGEAAGIYLSRDHTAAYKNPSFGAYEWLRLHAGPASKVCLLGETRSFHCPVSVYVNWKCDVPVYEEWFQAGLLPDEAVERFRGMGITHVLLNAPEFSWAVLPQFRTPDRLAWLSKVLDRLGPPVYRNRWCALFEVGTEPALLGAGLRPAPTKKRTDATEPEPNTKPGPVQT